MTTLSLRKTKNAKKGRSNFMQRGEKGKYPDGTGIYTGGNRERDWG